MNLLLLGLISLSLTAQPLEVCKSGSILTRSIDRRSPNLPEKFVIKSRESGETYVIDANVILDTIDNQFDGSSFGYKSIQGKLYPSIESVSTSSEFFYFMINAAKVEFGLETYWDPNNKKFVNILSTSNQPDTSFGTIVSLHRYLETNPNMILVGTIHSHPESKYCCPSGFSEDGNLSSGGDRLFYHQTRYKKYSAERTPTYFHVLDLESSTLIPYNYTSFRKIKVADMNEFKETYLELINGELDRLLTSDLKLAQQKLYK